MERKYISLITDGYKNVVSSQVIEYLEMLKDFNLVFDTMFIMNGRDYLNIRRRLKEIKAEINGKTSGQAYFYPVFRKESLLGTFISLVLFNMHFFPFFPNKKLVIHGRGKGAFLAEKIKSSRRNISYVYDCRGDDNYEFHANKAGVPSEEIAKKLNIIRSREKRVIDNAGHVIAVSNILKNKLIDRYGTTPEKISVIPCTADHRKFYFNPDIRAEMRNKLGLNNRFVLVFPGGVGYWHYSDKVFEVVSLLMRHYSDIYFLMLTPNVNEANALAEKANLAHGSYLIRNVRHSDVPLYLQAADMGMLLRERHPINEVAAPTKFAEYIMSGLPVMISDNIGDYSDFVKSKRVGIVFNNDASAEEYVTLFNEFYERRNSVEKHTIAQLGFDNFAKCHYAEVMKQIYANI